MHLVIVSPFPPAITGIGQYGYHITRALAKSGVFSRVTVLAGSQINGEHPNHLGLTEIEYCWAPGQSKARQAILARVKRLSPDLVWFNLRIGMFGESPWQSVSGLLAPMLTRWLGFPTVVTVHEMVELSDFRLLKAPGGPFAPLGARFITDLVTQADVVCLTMQKHLDWFAKQHPQVECVHIPLGAYNEPVLMDENDGAELLLFNMLAPFKGVEILLEVFPLLRLEFPKLQLTIAGEEHPRFPGYVQSIRDRFAGMDGIRWLGKIPNEDVIEIFHRAQIVVLPYRASTGASSVLNQAAAYGRAIVASDLSELRALVHEGNFQVEFFENGNAESLRNAIHTLIISAEKRRAQAQNNFKAIQNARIEVTCQRYLQAFNRALEKRKSVKRIPVSRIEIESA
jgi:glycosyltransferase involved in cell wall biosynthesis